jgi:dGTP triphosphohydrolase
LSALFLKKFKELAVKRVYVIRPVLEFEACGFDVTSGLLDVFVQPLKLDVVEE